MEDLKLAILIDADNISPKYVKVILDEAATFGVAACKRIYGDWSDVRLKSWWISSRLLNRHLEHVSLNLMLLITHLEFQELCILKMEITIMQCLS